MKSTQSKNVNLRSKGGQKTRPYKMSRKEHRSQGRLRHLEGEMPSMEEIMGIVMEDVNTRIEQSWNKE